MSRRIAVVGAGMAAARFAHQFLALGGEAELTLYGAEPRGPYNRVLLADVLTGRYDAEAIALPAGAAELRVGAEVLALDTAARVLRLAGGGPTSSDTNDANDTNDTNDANDADDHADPGDHTASEPVPYDQVVLATGANPVLPPIRGLRLAHGGLKAGVHSFRTVADCDRLAADAARAERAVVIGGGVLGVSAARALAALGLPVEIVHQAPQLIERQLDERAGRALERGLAELGVATYCGNRARALHGTDRVTGVELANGYLLDADLVVLACGVRPRTGLAHSAGLRVGSGVLVDDRLAASAPDTYAIGDCAEHRGTVHGLSAPAWEQADVLAARLSGADPDALYTGSRPLARLTAGPLEYAAFGEVGDDGPGLDVLRLADATRGSYKKLVLRGDRLVGGILLGDLATVGALTRAYERNDPLPADPLHLLTTRGAS
ncbi:NAD(P)/FAD-dependent oxidoreductase [Kitasatospora sp. NPDC050543]|uniref:NAD(P)/FAD-dependent oxidoreductase n=1 Tax=Kitasatospora sp. NPDC050543 TaxID=3364054 RepID=UPI00379D72F8